MSGSPRRLLALSVFPLVVLLLLGALAPLARAEVTAAQVEEARQKLREVSARLQDEVGRYEAALLEESQLRDRVERVRLDLTGRERELALARTAARARVADLYMAAGSGEGSRFMAGGDEEGPARLAYLDSVALTDRELVNRLEQARRDYVGQQELLIETLTAQKAVSAELEVMVDGIYSELAAADAEYRTVKQQWDAQEAERLRREEEERQRQLWLSTSTTTDPTATTSPGGPSPTTPTTLPPTPPPPPAPPGTMACPVDGASAFRDSWGEARPGGRGHTGVDMMSPTGTPLVAIENGTIENMSWHYAGGIGLYVHGESGDTWYYCHLSAYAAGISEGSRVAAGQLIGYVGETGNAAGPHLHLAHILPSGQYVDPYPVVAGLCL